MSKKILWLSIVVLAVAVIAFALNFFSDSPKENIDNSLDEKVLPQKEVPFQENLAGTGSMDYLMSRGENLECNIIYEAAGVGGQAIEGTYFTSRERLRGDFLVPDAGAGAVSSMIIKDNEMYTWTEINGEKYGMKVDLDTLNKTKESEDNLQVKEAVPLDAAIKYDCKVWENVDGSVFEAPTDIIFKDFAEIRNTGMEFGTSYEEASGNVDKCAVCKQLSGSEKAQCLSALSCQ
jgi:hypothetical protein